MNEHTTYMEKHFLLIVGLLFLFVYLLGAFFPSTWWATHWFAFFSSPTKIALLIASGVFLGSSYLFPKGVKSVKLPQRSSPWIPVVFASIAALLMYLFPMAHDYYGDAYQYMDQLDVVLQEIPEGTHEAFFTLGLSPWAGHKTVLSIVTYLAYFAQISYREAFVLFDAVCGGLFVWVWLSFLRGYFKEIRLQVLLGLAGMTAPCMLVFFGHYESYAPVCVAFLWLMTSMLKQSISPSRFRLLGMGAIWVLCVKLHTVALLFLPAMAILGLHSFVPTSSLTTRLGTWKGVGVGMLAPVFMVGAALYFFVFGDHVDDRALVETAMEFDHLFLPLFSPKPPLDTYNLLSFNHIFDYVNEVFLWSPVALMLVIVAAVLGRKVISWNSLSLIVTGLCLILFMSLFFVINPLLSMQMDWDLMAIPAIPFLCFAAALVKEARMTFPVSRVAPMVYGVVLCCLPAFYLHTQTDLLAARYEQLGIRIFRSYYEWSSTVIQRGADLRTFVDTEEGEAHKQHILDKLKPYARPGVDFEYARLLTSQGKYYLRTAQRPALAIPYLRDAYTYDPQGKRTVLFLTEAYFLLQSYEQAFSYSQKLIEKEYPSLKKALAVGVNCAIEARKFEEAEKLCARIMQLKDGDPMFKEIYQRLQANDTLDLGQYFVQGTNK